MLAIEYPFLNATVSTLLRVELLSGARYAHILAPGEDSWRVPASTAGGAPAWLREAGGAVLDGVRHFGANPVHVVFLLSLLLLGAWRTALRLVGVFTAGQLVAVALHAVTGLGLGPAFAEIGVAVGAALIAREALRPVDQRGQLAPLAAAAGLVHGLGIAGSAVGPAGALAASLMVLGIDAALVLGVLLGVLVGALVVRLVPRRIATAPGPAIATYLVAGVALGLAFAVPMPSSSAAASTPRGISLPGLAVPDSTANGPASKRLTAQIPDETLQSFVTIGAFEVRHEVLVRLADLAERFGLDPEGTLVVTDQAGTLERIRDLVATRSGVEIDGRGAEPESRRADFLTLDGRGALPRPTAVPELVESAWVGVTTIYLTRATPRSVSLTWDRFDLVPAVPATVTDPEFTRTVELTAGRPRLGWTNELTEDPMPLVRSTAVEPETVWVPIPSLLSLGVAIALVLLAVRREQRALPLAVARGLTVVALLLAPVQGVTWAMPFSTGSVPDAAGAKQILAGVLPNLYRAFEFPTESTAYDRLSLSVTGEALADVYLEHRSAVEREERGGARARVEAVEVREVESVQAVEGPGFAAQARWTVGGTVTHFGHRHFRQNAYDARIVVVPVDGTWKIESIDVHNEERL